MNKKSFFTLIFLAGCNYLFAQQTFKYKAAIAKVDTNGFYAISLTPGILADAQSSLADIRLHGDGNAVPYLFGTELPVKKGERFIAFPQVNVGSKTDSSTVFIVENNERYIINQLYLKLRNTAVNRTINLSGSDDLNNWYAIKENVVLGSSSTGNDKGIDEQLVNFPYSTYHYFKITVDHKNKAPIAILQAGVYKQESAAPAYVQIPIAGFFQTDSTHSSTAVIKFGDNYPLNKIHLDISSPKFYKRRINVYALSGKVFRLLTDTVISSSGGTDLIFSAKTKAIELEIFNEDNPPLNIKLTTAYQLSQKLIAYLEKGKSYEFLFGDSTATAPNFDLKFFADSVQANLKQIIPSAVEGNSLYQSKQIKVSNSIPAWAIWVAIIAVTLVLVLLTLKMTQEVKKRDAVD